MREGAKSSRNWYDGKRQGGLLRFAIAITVFNLLGHTLFGFEQSWAQPFVALLTGYAMDFLLETMDARLNGRRPRYAGTIGQFAFFFLPAHITSLAISMLIYTNQELWATAFAVSVAIASKWIFRIPAGKGTRHFLNPSNFGITVILLVFPWVGIAPAYHFTENLSGPGDWILPAFIVVSGTFLNTKFTYRLPLLLSWVIGFFAQAAIRSAMFDTPLLAGLMPMTGVAFVLFTFYMVTDPPTTPSGVRQQVAFGASVAAIYGVLMMLHIVFGFFFALTIVCMVRGAWIASRAWLESVRTAEYRQPLATPALAPELTARGSVDA